MYNRYWKAWFLLVILCGPAGAAERKFDFSNIPENQLPPGFRSTVSGQGKPGDWRIILDDVPPLLPRFTTNSHIVTKQPVLAQLAADPTDEHFPLLVFEEETFGDFTLTTRFKTVSGVVEQMAGIVFRLQNETNYYVVRASSLGNTFRFYKVVNGERGPLIGPEMAIPSGVWHQLSITCRGNQIRFELDGAEPIPSLTDSSFGSGKIGFWVKSDSVSYFADTKIVYTRRDVPAQVIVRDVLKKYPKLVGLKIFIRGTAPETTRLLASKDETDVGEAGGTTEFNVITKGGTYYGKGKETVVVTVPLRDRNGETIAAVRITMKPFPGQTEENSVVRAAAILKQIQLRVSTLQDLLE